MQEASRKNVGAVPYERKHPFASNGGWVPVKVRGDVIALRYPNVCCWCLKATDQLSKLDPGTMYDAYVPLCETCRSYWKRRRKVIQTIFIVLPALAILAIWLMEKDRLIRFQTTTGTVAIAFVLFLFVVDRLGHPVKTSTAFRYRIGDDAEIKFKNRDYLNVFARHLEGESNEREFPLPPKHLK